MAILFTDLIPANKDLVEKNTLHHGRKLSKEEENQQMPVEEKKVGTISQIPLESPLEIELAKIRYTQEELEKVTQERNRRMVLSYQMKANAWSKRIKSKAYRKARREEKQRKEAEKIQINMLEEGEEPVEEEPQEKEVHPEALKAQEIAYNYIRTNINPEPVCIEQVHRQTVKDPNNTQEKDGNSRINSLLEIDKDDFVSEKHAVEDADKPWEKEDVLLGWNSWGGASIAPVKNSSNTKKISRSGVEIRKRKDFSVSHVILNEKTHLTRNQKYAINRLPYGYSSTEEYNEVMSFPIDTNHQPAVILNKLIKKDIEKKNHL